jgi:carbon monoxide dehydrogenase subunit G
VLTQKIHWIIDPRRTILEWSGFLSSDVVPFKGSKTMRIPYSIEIDCPPELLWTYLEDPAKLPLWMKGLVSFEPEGDGPRGPGSVATMRIKEGGKVSEYQSRLTAREPFEHLALVLTGKSFGKTQINVDYRLTDLGGKTRLDYLCTCESAGFFMRIMVALFSTLMKKQLVRFMKTLKGLAETEAGTAFARS